jgi:putative Holliday junction resolvase
MHRSGRLLGIDHGTKRIGLAVSDLAWLTARELTIVTRTSKTEDFAKLRRIADEQQAAALVVGLPVNADAPEGAYTQADRVRTWVERLSEAVPLPIVLWDEQLTSVDAVEIARRQRRKREAPIDDLAARVMLQSYLDALRDGLAAPPALRDDSPDQGA